MEAYAKDSVRKEPEEGRKDTLEISISWDGLTLDVGHFQSPKLVTMGAHPLNDFSFTNEVLPENKNFPILVPHNKSMAVFVTSDFQGSLTIGNGEVSELNEVLATADSKTMNGIVGSLISLEEDDILSLRVGELEMVAKYVVSPKKLTAPPTTDREFLFLRLGLFSFAIHAAMILMFQFVPLDTYSIDGNAGKTTRFQVEEPPKIVRKKKDDFKIKKVEKKIEKKVIKKDKKVKKDAPVDQRPSDKQRIKNKGLLGILSQGMGNPGSGGSLFGKANQQKFLGKLLGASSNSVAFGLTGSDRGFGKGDGNGGNPYGDGGEWGYGGKKRKYGRRAISLRPKRYGPKTITQINPGTVYVRGALTKQQIAKVIRAFWAQIKFCYERQLMRNPKLAGKIVVRWVIAGDGTVQTASISQTTMNNERVENCITRKVYRWRFPKPNGGHSVKVNYPFVFRSAQ